MLITEAMVVAAGTTGDPELARLAPGANKALTPIQGRPAVSILVDNLKNCEAVSRVILVGDGAVQKAAPKANVLIDAADLEADSIMEGIRAAGDAARVLILRADMPLVSPEALSDLLTYAPDADVVYPIIEEPDMKSDFPERSPYYLKTKEGHFTGSTCVLVRPKIALSADRLLATLLEARTNPTALVGLVGPLFAMKVMVSSIGLGEFESHLCQSCQFTCRVFVSHYPELFISIDSARDIPMIEQALSLGDG